MAATATASTIVSDLQALIDANGDRILVERRERAVLELQQSRDDSPPPAAGDFVPSSSKFFETNDLDLVYEDEEVVIYLSNLYAAVDFHLLRRLDIDTVVNMAGGSLHLLLKEVQQVRLLQRIRDEDNAAHSGISSATGRPPPMAVPSCNQEIAGAGPPPTTSAGRDNEQQQLLLNKQAQATSGASTSSLEDNLDQSQTMFTSGTNVVHLDQSSTLGFSRRSFGTGRRFEQIPDIRVSVSTILDPDETSKTATSSPSKEPGAAPGSCTTTSGSRTLQAANEEKTAGTTPAQGKVFVSAPEFLAAPDRATGTSTAIAATGRDDGASAEQVCLTATSRKTAEADAIEEASSGTIAGAPEDRTASGSSTMNASSPSKKNHLANKDDSKMQQLSSLEKLANGQLYSDQMLLEYVGSAGNFYRNYLEHRQTRTADARTKRLHYLEIAARDDRTYNIATDCIRVSQYLKSEVLLGGRGEGSSHRGPESVLSCSSTGAASGGPHEQLEEGGVEERVLPSASAARTPKENDLHGTTGTTTTVPRTSASTPEIARDGERYEGPLTGRAKTVSFSSLLGSRTGGGGSTTSDIIKTAARGPVENSPASSTAGAITKPDSAESKLPTGASSSKAKSKRNVLVHCINGINRSCAVVVGFLMHHCRWKAAQAIDHVSRSRLGILTNAHFLSQLLSLERILEDDSIERSDYDPP
ncbi:unnamed protein product [Amoebophrya sp. A120]|nr:unnamed protein product [Amoebophrya sp. A120]|eukprot:GSA120T00018313001.1